jgi:hypothetical protein
MRLRVGLVVAVAGCSAVQVSAASATVGCSASAIRVVSSTSTFEPVSANPGFIPCADDAQGQSVVTPSAVGSVTVEASGLSAVTHGNDPGGPPCCIIDAYAEGRVGAVTVTVGTTTISATGLDAVADSESTCGQCILDASAQSTIAKLTVNGNAIELVGDDPNVPIPGVGTLHVEWANDDAPGGPPPGQPAIGRALWLEGTNGVPDVIVAEAKACDNTESAGAFCS